MTTPSQPTSSKRRRPQSGSIAIRFAPGQNSADLVFNNVPDIIDFIRDQTDSDVVVYVDLTAVGGSFEIPVRTDYDFRRVFLDGFFNNDGTIPIIIWPDGAKIVDDCDFIRKRDVDFQIECTSTIPWTPNKASRIEDEQTSGYLAQVNTCPFVSTENMGADLLTYQGGPGCGLLNFGGSELVYVAASSTFRAFLNETCEIQSDLIETEDSTASVDIRMSTESRLDSQANVDPSSLTKSALMQSGTAFPEETYSGKDFLKSDEDFKYWRSADDTVWRRHEEGAVVDYVGPVGVQSTAGVFQNRHSFNFDFVSGETYDICVDYEWNYGTTGSSFLGQLLVNGVQLGQIDNNGNRYFHFQEPKEGAGGAAGSHVVGTSSRQRLPFKHKVQYVAPSTASLSVVYRWAPQSAADAGIWQSSVSIRRRL